MLQSLMAHIYLLGAGQGIFLLGFVLFSNKIRNKTTRFLLATLVLLFTYSLVYYFMAYSGHIIHVPHLFATHGSLSLLYGPLFYFLLRSQIKNESLNYKSLVHLLPWAIFVIYMLRLYMAPAEVKINMYERDMAQGGFYKPHLIPLLINLVMTLQLGIYLYFSHRLVNRYFRHKILQPLLYAFIAFTALSTAYHFIHFVGIGYFSIVCYGVKFLMGVMIYTIAYTLFLNAESWETPVVKPKYNTSSIDTASSELIANKIQQAMTRNTLFLNPDLSLADLAKHVDLQPHYLSRAINEHLKCSFSDWVNKHRVEYAKKLLKETDDKIIAVAYSAGFNNKVTFTNAFKKHTGQTPSAYRDNLNERLEMKNTDQLAGSTTLI